MIQCKFENGKIAYLRHVTVAVIVTNNKGEFLLEKRAPHLINGGLYCLPSGFLDRDEDTKATVVRELFEETGLRGKVLFLFRFNDNPHRPKEDRQNVDMIYVAEIVGGKMKLNSEVTSVGWFGEKNLPKEEEFAFDHRDNILKYLEYKNKQFKLPIIG